MKTLAFIQNMWFVDPKLVKEQLDSSPERRTEIIRMHLFSGWCRVGNNITVAFGERECANIIFESASKKTSAFGRNQAPPDLAHMTECMYRHRPDVVITFGEVAGTGYDLIRMRLHLSPAPVLVGTVHPVARCSNVIRTLSAAARIRRRALLRLVDVTSKQVRA